MFLRSIQWDENTLVVEAGMKIFEGQGFHRTLKKGK